MYFIDRSDPTFSGYENVPGTCPSCGVLCVFKQVGIEDVYAYEFENEDNEYLLSIRKCPSCDVAVFIRYNEDVDGSMDSCYPFPRAKIEREDCPEMILENFDEAVTCFHAGCYRASAIMIRRTLEALTEHFEATGRDLHSKIINLGEKLLVAEDILENLMSLKALGNDAAHLQVKSFHKVDREEVSVAIDVIQDIITNWLRRESSRKKLNSLKKRKH